MPTLSYLSNVYLPILFKRSTAEGKLFFDELQKFHPELVVHDTFDLQKAELLATRQPTKTISDDAAQAMYQQWVASKTIDNEGVWVYYPWRNTVVHLLEKEEFIELRTSRNQHKITAAEQKSLVTKKIGIIGLSVGHAVAVTIATERIAGHIKLADFDTIALSNLNRIKTSLFTIGTNKCIVTAREIAEIDPFITIECLTEGLNDDNIESFLLDGNPLDLLIDECDGLDMKIKCRIAAKKHGIPVMMETSDKGMLDVERFDKEPERPILHGLVPNIDPSTLKNLSTEEKIPLVMKIAEAHKSSSRGKASLLEIGQTIGTWPQLASAVTLGGAVVTDVARRLLLGQFTASGRFYTDLEVLVNNPYPPEKDTLRVLPIGINQHIAATIASNFLPIPGCQRPSFEQINAIVEAACSAPSTGNDQPWKWLYQNGTLFLFHDRSRSESFGDYAFIASDISFGAAFENLLLKSYELGLAVVHKLHPSVEFPELIATIHFFTPGIHPQSTPVFQPNLVQQIPIRCTNRNLSSPLPLEASIIEALTTAVSSIAGAKHFFISNREDMLTIAAIIGGCDKIRLLHPEGHYDFVHREMRWTPQDAEIKRDGIDVRTLGLTGGQIMALSIIKDSEVAATLKSIDGGNALVNVAIKTVESAAGLGVITLPTYCRKSFFEGGRAMERLWLTATALGLAIHPLISPFYLFPREVHGNGEGLDEANRISLQAMRKKLLQIVPIEDDTAEVFLYKIAKAPAPTLTTPRLPISSLLFVVNK